MTKALLVRAANVAALMVSFVLAGCAGQIEESQTPSPEESESSESAETASAKRTGASSSVQEGTPDLELGRDTPGPSGERSSGTGFKRPPE
jgi:hypothetical protein